jgi:hypothetical protein
MTGSRTTVQGTGQQHPVYPLPIQAVLPQMIQPGVAQSSLCLPLAAYAPQSGAYNISKAADPQRPATCCRVRRSGVKNCIAPGIIKPTARALWENPDTYTKFMAAIAPVAWVSLEDCRGSGVPRFRGQFLYDGTDAGGGRWLEHLSGTMTDRGIVFRSDGDRRFGWDSSA